MRPRGLAAVSLLSGLLLATAGCAAEEKPAASAEEIPIGVNIELSGGASVLGQSHKNALEIVIEQVNRKGVLGGKKIKLITKDNKTDPTEAIRIAKEMWDNDKIVGMIGTASSPTSVPVSAEAEKRKIPMISMASSGAVYRPKPDVFNKYVFKTPPNNKDMAEVQVEELFRRGIKKVAYITVTNAYGDASWKAFQPAAQAKGLEIVAFEKFGDKETSMTVPVAKALAKKPEAIAIAAIHPQAAALAKDIKAAKFTGTVMYEGGAGAELFLKAASVNAEDFFMVHPGILSVGQVSATTPPVLRQKEFFEEYTKRFGQYSGFASYSADALHMYVAAIEKAGSADPTKIRDALEALDHDGLTGHFKFSAEYHGGVDKSSLVLLVARGGQWVPAN